MKPLKVKILGSGNAAQKHARAFAELSELYQITDSDDHDIVDICTANYMHGQQCREALRAHRHVIVEKPICASLAECDRLIDREWQADGVSRVFPVFQYRFAGEDHVFQVHQGGLRSATRWKRDASYYDGWRGDWTKALGGALTSHGIHTIDLIIQRHGMPKIVTAAMDTHLGPERFAYVCMGESGDDMIRVSTLIHPDVEQGGFVLGDSHTGYTEQFRRIHAAITQGAPAPVTLAEARQSLEVLTAAYWSAYTGEPAMLPIEPDHPFYRGWSEAFAQRSERLGIRSE